MRHESDNMKAQISDSLRKIESTVGIQKFSNLRIYRLPRLRWLYIDILETIVLCPNRLFLDIAKKKSFLEDVLTSWNYFTSIIFTFYEAQPI